MKGLFLCSERLSFSPFFSRAGADVGVVLVPLWLYLSNQHVHMGHMPPTVYWNSTGDLKFFQCEPPGVGVLCSHIRSMASYHAIRHRELTRFCRYTLESYSRRNTAEHTTPRIQLISVSMYLAQCVPPLYMR